MISPARGTWTGVIFGDVTAVGGTNGTIKWRVATQRFTPFASVRPRVLILAPGKSGAVKVSATTPSSPGDQAGSIVLSSDLGLGGTTSTPVTLRSLANVAQGGAFSGLLTGGNGRGPEGQIQYYEFNVRNGVRNIIANVSFTNDANDTVGAYLISPDGDTLGYGENTLYTIGSDGSITGTNGNSLTAYTLNPVPGTWTLIVDLANSVVGDETSQPFTGKIRVNGVTASAPGLPQSASVQLTAGTPVTIPVSITNNGAAPAAPDPASHRAGRR
ncbi:MAG: hypothetical protein ACREQR_20480 [Candidatus Binataceae bacterium]